MTTFDSSNQPVPLDAKAIDDWVFQTGDIVESDALFVFGSSHHVSDIAARIVQLWSRLGIKRVIVTGYRGEAEAIAIAAHMLGVPSSIFDLECRASNTYENVVFSANLLRQHCRNAQLHVIAKLHAAPRSLLTLRKSFPQWRFALHTVDYFGVTPESWRENQDFRRKVGQELKRISDYGEKGHLAAPDAPWSTAMLREVASALLESPLTEAQRTNSGPDPNAFPRASVFEEARQQFGDMRLVSVVVDLEDSGGRSPTLRTTVVERPDAVGVLAYDDVLDEVVLVEQFRAGPFLRSGVARMLEVVAGYLDPDEESVDAAKRELFEETGLLAERLIPIGRYFPTPTLSTEELSLWCALVDAKAVHERVTNGAEQINVIRVKAGNLASMVVRGDFSNALTLLAVTWLLQVRPLLQRARQGELE